MPTCSTSLIILSTLTKGTMLMPAGAMAGPDPVPEFFLAAIKFMTRHSLWGGPLPAFRTGSR